MYFRALMQRVFSHFNDFSFFYMDDVLVLDDSENDHLEHLRLIFSQKIREASRKQKLSKGAFFKGNLQYLGHLILGKGLCPLKENPETMVN